MGSTFEKALCCREKKVLNSGVLEGSRARTADPAGAEGTEAAFTPNKGRSGVTAIPNILPRTLQGRREGWRGALHPS